MTPFEIATNDIFDNPDFLETANIAGQKVPVIVSELTEDPSVTEFGVDSGVSFFLRVKRELLAVPPKKGTVITCKGGDYRTDSVVLDSSGLVYRINLVSKSTR